MEHINIPIQWKESYTKYPHGFTIFEAISAWATQVNVMIDKMNLTQEQIDKLFTDTLPENVENVLNEWLLDGRLATLIDLNIDGVKATIVEVKTQNEIEPDNMRLTVLDSDDLLVQRAIDKALLDRNNYNIKLGRIYNIAHTLKVNNQGTILTFTGSNGGFCNKQNAPMFSSDRTEYDGMINFDKVKFIGDTNYLSSPLFDLGGGSKLIQLYFNSCSFFDCPNVIYSSALIQQVKFINCVFKVQHDYVIKGLYAYDILIDGCNLEASFGGLISLTTIDTNMYACNGIRIINNCLEAISGQRVIVLNQAFSLDISNNYFEGNAYLDIDLSGAIKQHKGLKITGNNFGNYATTNKNACVRTGLLYSNQGYDFSSNAGTQMVFDFTGSGGRYINMTGGMYNLSTQPIYMGIEDNDYILYGENRTTKELVKNGNSFELPLVNFNTGDKIADMNEYITMAFKRVGSPLYMIRYTGFLYVVSGYNSVLSRMEIRCRFKPIMAQSQNNFSEEGLPLTTLSVKFKSTGTDNIQLGSMGTLLNDSIVLTCTDYSVDGCYYGKAVRIE